MSCDALLEAAAFDAPRCTPIPDGWRLSLPLRFPDGDVPYVIVRRVEQRWTVDDDGQSAGRVFDRGSVLTESMVKTLDAIAETNRLEIVDGALYGSCDDEHLSDMLVRVGTALLQADALPLLTPPEREGAFADHVVEWLRQLDMPLHRNRRISAGGRRYQVTAMVFRSEAERAAKKGTAVQAVDDQRGLEHTFYVFSSLADVLPPERLLAVTSDSVYRRRSDIQSLTTVGYVTHRSVPDTVANWLRAPDSARLTYGRELPQTSLE